MKKFIGNEDGMVLVFSALVLPVLLLVAIFVLDSGQLYARHGQLQHLARQAANSGILMFGDVLQERATANYAALCEVEFPPGICSSTNRFDFLSETEVQLLAQSLSTQVRVDNAIQAYSKQYDPADRLEDDLVLVSFPYELEPLADTVKIKVEINDQAPGFLVKILPQVRTVQVEAQSFISLNS
jgi:hypothetical protein